MKLKRFVAYLVDIMIVGLVATALSSINVLNPYYDNYLESSDSFNETIDSIDEDNVTSVITSDLFVNQMQNTLKYSVCTTIISLGCYFLYFVGFQKWNKNQTLGKKLMKLKVVNEDGSENISVINYTVRTIVLYNLLFTSIGLCTAFYLTGKSFLITFAVVSVIGYIITYAGYLMILIRKDGRGLHDIMGFTKVVEVENVPSKS